MMVIKVVVLQWCKSGDGGGGSGSNCGGSDDSVTIMLIMIMIVQDGIDNRYYPNLSL
jgi:hypothetical protein